MKFCLLGMCLRKYTNNPLILTLKKMFEIIKGTFFSNCKVWLKIKETFDTKKVGCKQVIKFSIGELVWFNV